ncbi:MAG: cytochrome c oxidase subunit II [Blastocatellia bacterium]
MGKIVGLLIVILTVASVWMFVGQDTWWFPHSISEHGKAIDAQFMRTLVVVGIAFTLAQLALGYAVVKFGRRGADRAVYTHGSNTLEVTWTVVTAVVFVVLAVLGQRVWADLHLKAAPEGAVKVEVVAQQFQFNFHYAGKDGVLGKTDPKYMDDSALNYVGLDPRDSNARDDVQVTTLVIPENRPVELTLKSKDVIHSFFVPALRFKQDTVPGLAIKVHFTALEMGKYEIPCAELCGQLHSTMKANLIVVSAEDYDAIAAMTEEKFKERMNELLQQYQ